MGDRLLDAPVLGTRKPAEDGALVVLVAGTPAAREAAGPVLEAVGSRVVTVGEELGSASALKLACNSWVATINAATGQALALAEAQGVDPALFLEAIAGGPVDTPYAQLKGAVMQSRDWDTPAFAVDGVRKDVGLMLDAAERAGVPDGLLTALLGLYDSASERGHGAADMAAVRSAFDPGRSQPAAWRWGRRPPVGRSDVSRVAPRRDHRHGCGGIQAGRRGDVHGVTGNAPCPSFVFDHLG